MSIQLLDPVADVEVIVREREREIRSLDDRKVGFVFNQHVTALAFWKKLEQEVRGRFKPSSVHSLYKVNTWAPAPRAELEKLAAESEYVLVGVGA